MIRSMAILLALATAVSAQDREDAAHRADRLRTQQLNHRALTAAAPRVTPGDDRAYRAARERYERALADWRRRDGACRAGDWSAC